MNAIGVFAGRWFLDQRGGVPGHFVPDGITMYPGLTVPYRNPLLYIRSVAWADLNGALAQRHEF